MDTKVERELVGWTGRLELTYIHWIYKITHENLLYSTGNSMLCDDWNGKEIQKIGEHM